MLATTLVYLTCIDVENIASQPLVSLKRIDILYSVELKKVLETIALLIMLTQRLKFIFICGLNMGIQVSNLFSFHGSQQKKKWDTWMWYLLDKGGDIYHSYKVTYLNLLLSLLLPLLYILYII